MASFVILGQWTGQGVGRIEEAPDRLDAARETFAKQGVEVKSFYLTMGRYDFVTVLEAADAADAARALLAIASEGNARTETLTAFDEEEYRELIEALP